MNGEALVLVALLGYLIGSVPTAYIIAKRKGINIFEIGSGNMGATNIARALSTRDAVITGVVDVLKGVAAVLIGRALAPQDAVLGGVLGAFAAVVGHSWSVFILWLTGQLRGGKSAGVATGTWLILAPLYVSAACLALFGLVVWRTRIVSLGVLLTISFGAAWILLWVALRQLPPVMVVYAVGLLALIVLRHRSNIERLIQGTERRVGERK